MLVATLGAMETRFNESLSPIRRARLIAATSLDSLPASYPSKGTSRG